MSRKPKKDVTYCSITLLMKIVDNTTEDFREFKHAVMNAVKIVAKRCDFKDWVGYYDELLYEADIALLEHDLQVRKKK